MVVTAFGKRWPITPCRSCMPEKQLLHMPALQVRPIYAQLIHADKVGVEHNCGLVKLLPVFMLTRLGLAWFPYGSLSNEFLCSFGWYKWLCTSEGDAADGDKRDAPAAVASG